MHRSLIERRLSTFTRSLQWWENPPFEGREGFSSGDFDKFFNPIRNFQEILLRPEIGQIGDVKERGSAQVFFLFGLQLKMHRYYFVKVPLEGGKFYGGRAEYRGVTNLKNHVKMYFVDTAVTESVPKANVFEIENYEEVASLPPQVGVFSNVDSFGVLVTVYLRVQSVFVRISCVGSTLIAQSGLSG